MAQDVNVQNLLSQVQQRAENLRPGVVEQVREQLQARGAEPRVLNTIQNRLQNARQGGMLSDVGPNLLGAGDGGGSGQAQVKRVQPSQGQAQGQESAASQTQTADGQTQSATTGGGFRMPTN